MRKMKYLKLFESYSKLFESVERDLLDQLGDDFIEEYWDNNLAYTDAEDVVSMFPSMVWDYVDDDRVLDTLKSDEIDNYGVGDFNDSDFKDYINDKYIKEDDYDEIFKLYIENEVDLDEFEDLKNDLKDETDENERKSLKKQIRKIKKEIKIIKEMSLSELLDEMDEENLKDVISDIFDEYDFVETIIEDRFKEYYSLKDYVENVWGSTDSIEFGNSNSGRRGDWDWILNYVDDNALLKNYNYNEEFSHKKDTLENYISDTMELQEELLKIDKKNSLDLFDLFGDAKNNIGDTYEFQKAYIEEYTKDYADGDEEDLPEGKGLALKKLYDKFGLDRDIEEEYVDYMHYVLADKYNL